MPYLAPQTSQIDNSRRFRKHFSRRIFLEESQPSLVSCSMSCWRNTFSNYTPNISFYLHIYIYIYIYHKYFRNWGSYSILQQVQFMLKAISCKVMFLSVFSLYKNKIYEMTFNMNMLLNSGRIWTLIIDSWSKFREESFWTSPGPLQRRCWWVCCELHFKK